MPGNNENDPTVQREEAAVPVPSKDRKADAKKKKEEKKEELSEEDQQKKAELDLMVERLQDPDVNVSRLALESIKSELRSATSSMTSVPKPLKFLRAHYNTVKALHERLPDSDHKRAVSDLVSVMAMTMAAPDARDCLNYRLTGTREPASSWGHEYLRHMAREISAEYTERVEQSRGVEELLALVDEIVPYDMQHNAEAEAVDLLLEVEQLDRILQHVDTNNFARVGLYLLSCSFFAADSEEWRKILMVAYEVYVRQGQWADAMRVALKLSDMDLVRATMDRCEDRLAKYQMAFLLARQRVNFPTDEEKIGQILSNERLSEHFLHLARDLDVLEPKTPDDIYKSHLEEKAGRGNVMAALDSAKQNLASTFVNAFVNAGFGRDLLMTPEGNAWLYKNKEHGMMSATASMGMLLLWDVDGGLTQIDKFQYSGEDYIKAGALLAFGVVNSGVRNECDPALALLSEHLESASDLLKIGAIVGLGLAYAGSAREDVLELLTPLVIDTSGSLESSALAALSLGLIFVGTRNEDIAQAILQTLMERSEAQLNASHSRFFGLGLGLLFLAQQDAADATLEAVKALAHPIGKTVELTVETCAFACSGNVLKVQKMLHACADHLEEKDAGHQLVAVLGLGLISMGEEIGADMALRSLDHLLQYGELPIRRAVPLCLGLLSISNPRMAVMDTLSKLSHDTDAEVSQNAILALGLIGAGSNNARLAGILRQLASYYQKDANHLFVVRVAQGLLHMGKGLISLSPFHSERLLVSPVALAGLLATLFACMDMKNLILQKSHYMLYYLVTAMYPRMLMTLDENLQPLAVSVRVGQAVDVVGQAGRPKTITGFQTHTTPVLLAHGERAELATEEYIPVSTVLENFVILKRNPDFKPE